MEYNFPGAFDTFYLTAFPIASVIWEPSLWNPGQRTQAGLGNEYSVIFT